MRNFEQGKFYSSRAVEETSPRLKFLKRESSQGQLIDYFFDDDRRIYWARGRFGPKGELMYGCLGRNPFHRQVTRVSGTTSLLDVAMPKVISAADDADSALESFAAEELPIALGHLMPKNAFGEGLDSNRLYADAFALKSRRMHPSASRRVWLLSSFLMIGVTAYTLFPEAFLLIIAALVALIMIFIWGFSTKGSARGTSIGGGQAARANVAHGPSTFANEKPSELKALNGRSQSNPRAAAPSRKRE